MSTTSLRRRTRRRAFDLSREALTLVPADDTASALLAITAENLGRHAELIETAEKLTDVPSPPPAHFVEENRTAYRNGLVRAYAGTGNAEKAIVSAFDLLDEHPDGFGSWDAPTACLNELYGSAAIEFLVPLALKTSVGTFMEPIIRNYPPRALAEFSVAYVAGGGQIPEVVRAGLLAAAMSDHDEAYAALLEQASRLSSDVRLGLADRVTNCGRADLGDLLRSHPTAVAV